MSVARHKLPLTAPVSWLKVASIHREYAVLNKFSVYLVGASPLMSLPIRYLHSKTFQSQRPFVFCANWPA